MAWYSPGQGLGYCVLSPQGEVIANPKTILLLTGIAILTGQLQVLGFLILEYFPALGNLG